VQHHDAATLARQCCGEGRITYQADRVRARAQRRQREHARHQSRHCADVGHIAQLQGCNALGGEAIESLRHQIAGGFVRGEEQGSGARVEFESVAVLVFKTWQHDRVADRERCGGNQRGVGQDGQQGRLSQESDHGVQFAGRRSATP